MQRRTETTKWTDPWYRQLRPEFKLAWLYLLDNCDNAGVIDLDRPMANFQIGFEVDWEAFFESSGPRLRQLANGKIFIVKFLLFQYGEFSERAPFHRKVKVLLAGHRIENVGHGWDSEWDRESHIEREGVRTTERAPDLENRNGSAEPGSGAAKGKGAKGGPGGADPPFDHRVLAGTSEALQEAVTNWLAYKAERREGYKPTGLRTFLTRVARLTAEHGERAIIDAIERAISGTWKGWEHDLGGQQQGRGPPQPRIAPTTFAQQRVTNSLAAVKAILDREPDDPPEQEHEDE